MVPGRHVKPLRRARQLASGVAGEPGRPGLDGVPGMDGAPGLDGVPGADGRNGRDGVDGRDGQPGRDGSAGERGPQGPPGPAGDPGKRGKPGPPGKLGPPGAPGTCAYRATIGDSCRLLSQTKLTNRTNQGSGGLLAWKLNSSDSTGDATPYQVLLMAPTMVGASFSYDDDQDQGDRSGERQVTVNEGDNIQLSCQAHGLPPPEFQWRRSQPDDTIVVDLGLDLRITSYPGAQLPLLNVDRLHSGGYECLATNGVPPSASKRVHLNVNYAPTVRLCPWPSVQHLPKVGASISLECLVEANPAPFTYWMFNSLPIMSVPSESAPTNLAMPGLGPNLGKKYIITESAGQLATGAHYSILTLNISSAELDDLGDYKCVSKNLVGQTTGHFLLLPPLDSQQSIDSIDTDEVAKLKEMILERNKSDGSLSRASGLDLTLGWPSRLTPGANYTTFGNEDRPKISSRLVGRLLADKELNGESLVAAAVTETANKTRLVEMIVNTLRLATGGASATTNNDNSTLIHVSNTTNNNNIGSMEAGDRFASVGSTNGPQKSPSKGTLTPGKLREDGNDSVPSSLSSSWSCRVEKPDPKHQLVGNDPKNLTRAAQETLLLDQVGKPVYLGSLPASDLLNWWSLVAAHDFAHAQAKVYSSSARNPSELFEYDTVGDLLAHLNWQNEKNKSTTEAPLGGSQSPRRSTYKLRHHMIGNSHVVSKDGTIFCYVSSHLSSSQLQSQLQQSQSHHSPEQQSQQERQQTVERLSLADLFIVMLNLNSGEYRYLKLDTRLASNLERQPLDLGADYQMERLELVTDENGLWLLVPTIDWLGGSNGPPPSQSDSNSSKAELPEQTGAISEPDMSAPVEPIRRLQVLQVVWRQNETLIGVDYQVSLKLDWRKLGKMFIIDGVLYGIRDRHLYTSKLELAYDLYGCRLLSSDYLNEPQRTFTNHFGNTQMIKYSPNEPRRLYTIDNGNLLWCPVKLVKIKSSEI